jgi:hypothetical protein
MNYKHNNMETKNSQLKKEWNYPPSFFYIHFLTGVFFATTGTFAIFLVTFAPLGSLIEGRGGAAIGAAGAAIRERFGAGAGLIILD